MFNLFKKKEVFPKETESGNVYLCDDNLFYEDHGNVDSVLLSKLQYAYVEILGGRPYLFLFDVKQHYICCLQKGFSAVYPVLSQKFGFDDHSFFKIIASRKEQKKRIWIRKKEKNYQILSTKETDYSEGFEVLSSPAQFVSWDTSYQDFEKLNIGETYLSEFGIPYVKIKYPVRIGNLIINELEFCEDNDRKDIAIQSYFATLNNGLNTEGSYLELREEWMATIPTKLADAGYERLDQKYLSFDLGGISLSLCYTYDVEQYDDGSTSFGITNYRDYSDILLQERDDLDVEFIDILSFQMQTDFIPNYKNNSKVTAKPSWIEKKVGNFQTMYFNRATDHIGFTSDRYAIEFEKTHIEKIIIQNVLPAKGGGYAELIVKCKEAYPEVIFETQVNAFDEYVETIENLIGIQVELPEPYYNC